MKSELKFSKENFNKEELEATISEISESLIDNKNLFDEEENEDEDDSFDLDDDESETYLNDLLIGEFIDLNFYDNNEIENNLSLNNQQQLETEEYSDHNLDLEALLDEKFQNLFFFAFIDFYNYCLKCRIFSIIFFSVAGFFIL
ncbi:hypothetical protein C2G38_2155777 [Gigaspora rosea]|uniref:Uncharacterized protein n=1 Tax=Gigaspora rosea TaxID=44941 RepID=A0A397W586_9GLOM|nr:hypothetical protein C2G38_2155777 [Gigaspora rosea]